MQDQPLLEKIITVSNVELEEKKLSLFDTEKKKYSIWRIKQDGNPTVAFTNFEQYAMSANGKSFNIKYNEKPVPEKPNAFYRTIVMISECSAPPSQPSGVPTPTSDVNTRLSRLETSIEFIKGKMGIQEPETPLNVNSVVTESAGLPTEEMYQAGTNATEEEIDLPF